MSDTATNRFQELQSGCAPEGIGRGSGLTIRELNARLRGFFRRKGMRSRQWKTYEQKVRERRAEVRSKKEEV